MFEMPLFEILLTHLGKMGITCLAIVVGLLCLWSIGKLLDRYFAK